MTRVYKRRPDPKVAKVTVPLSEKMYDRLRAHAARVEIPFTALARKMIEAALEQGEVK